MRALIALIATVVLLAADATPGCEHLTTGAGMIWGPAGPGNDGMLFMGPAGELVWTNDVGVELRGTYRCGADGLFFRMTGSERDERADFRPSESRLEWGGRHFRLPAGFFGGPPARPAETVAATAPLASEPACRDLIGTTWEIRSLEGLPASADRMTGEKDGAAPRRPNLIFGTDRGTWTRADGQKESFGYRCDERGLTITLSGKPLRMERELGGFRYAGAPVRLFTPKAPALSCETLPGKTFEIGTTGVPKSTLGKDGFASDLEPVASAPPGPKAPWIKFAGLTVEWVTLAGPRVSVLYECDEKGVRVEHQHQRLLMPWHGDGLMWFGSPARPYVPSK